MVMIVIFLQYIPPDALTEFFVCTISVQDYEIMDAQCTAEMFSCPAAKCYCDRANWFHELARSAKVMSW